jgi:hypothetical protein
MKMVQPVIHDYLTQIFHKHYKMAPDPAAEAAMKFLEILELYKMELIIGEWVVPEPLPLEPLRPLSGWDKLAATLRDIEESGREPWLAREIQ